MCTGEFKLKNIGLTVEKPRILGEPQYGGVWLWYVLYRWIFAIWFLATLIQSAVEWPHTLGLKYLVYLIYWVLILITINELLKATCATYHYMKARNLCKDDQVYEGVPIVFKISWIFQNIIPVGCVLLFLLFYITAFNGTITYVNLVATTLGFVYIFIDLLVCGYPVHIFHVFHPMVFALLFVITTIIYVFSGPNLDVAHAIIHINYSFHPLMAGLFDAAVVCLIVPTLHMLHFGMYKLRLAIYKACCTGSSNKVGP